MTSPCEAPAFSSSAIFFSNETAKAADVCGLSAGRSAWGARVTAFDPSGPAARKACTVPPECWRPGDGCARFPAFSTCGAIGPFRWPSRRCRHRPEWPKAPPAAHRRRARCRVVAEAPGKPSAWMLRGGCRQDSYSSVEASGHCASRAIGESPECRPSLSRKCLSGNEEKGRSRHSHSERDRPVRFALVLFRGSREQPRSITLPRLKRSAGASDVPI